MIAEFSSSTCLLLLLIASSTVWLQLPVGSAAAATYTKSDCYFPFLYNGKEYSYCTRNSYHVLWCSLDKVYNGRWAPCDPEVPKAVMEKLAAAVEEVGREKTLLAAEEKAIDSVAKSVQQLAAVNAKAHLNKSAAIDALDKKLDSLNSTIKQLELHQKNLDRRESNQESLRPLEIGTMLLLTVAVAVMSTLLCALHCCPGKGGCGRGCDGGSQEPQLGASVPQTPQLSCLGLRPVQPGTSTADADDAAPPGTTTAGPKKFPGHFYHLTVDEEDEEEAGDDDEAGDEADEEEDDEDNGEDGSSEQHSRAAAALASAVSDRDRNDAASAAAGAAGSPTAAAAAAAAAPASGRRGFLRR